MKNRQNGVEASRSLRNSQSCSQKQPRFDTFSLKKYVTIEHLQSKAETDDNNPKAAIGAHVRLLPLTRIVRNVSGAAT